MEIDTVAERKKIILSVVVVPLVFLMGFLGRYSVTHGYDIVSTSEPIDVTLERVRISDSTSGMFSGFTLAFRDSAGTVHEESFSNYGGMTRINPFTRALFGFPEHCFEKYIGQQGKHFTLYNQKGTHVDPIFGNSSFDRDFKRGDVLEVACQGYSYN